MIKKRKFVPFDQGLKDLAKRFGLPEQPPPEKPVERGRQQKAKPSETPRMSRSDLRFCKRITSPALRERLNRREIHVTAASIIQNLYDLREISQEQAGALARNFNIKGESGRNYHKFVGGQMTLQELLKAEHVE